MQRTIGRSCALKRVSIINGRDRAPRYDSGAAGSEERHGSARRKTTPHSALSVRV
jgi:hypothetical protein